MKTVQTQTTGTVRLDALRPAAHEADKQTKRSQPSVREGATTRPANPITHEMIAERARSIWLSKGCVPGQDEMNWHQAEMEMRVAQDGEQGSGLGAARA